MSASWLPPITASALMVGPCGGRAEHERRRRFAAHARHDPHQKENLSPPSYDAIQSTIGTVIAYAQAGAYVIPYR